MAGRMPGPRAPVLLTLGGTLARLIIIGASLIGCGKGTQAKPDGGDGSVIPNDVPPVGMRSFDVVAVLSSDGSTKTPATSRFTLVLDPASGRQPATSNQPPVFNRTITLRDTWAKETKKT